MEKSAVQRIEMVVSDPSQLGSLKQVITLAAPEANLSITAGLPVRGEQGALDVLAVVASSSGLVTAIRTLPEFLRSRKTAMSITMSIDGEPVMLTATNIDEVMPILEKLLDG